MGYTVPYESIRRFTGKAELDKSINILEGIIRGIKLDRKINSDEIAELKHWCDFHRRFEKKLPFKDLIPLLEDALEDGELTEEEIKDILWCCHSFARNDKYYSVISADMQRLHGILHGILADNVINDEEILELKAWLKETETLEGLYPYEDIYSMLVEFMRDGVISQEERDYLKVFFSQFVDLEATLNLDTKEIMDMKESLCISGVCAIDPSISFKDSKFCFTGESAKAKRKQIQDDILFWGGSYSERLTQSVDYLVVCQEGSKAWAYTCYGRKIEEAMNLRHQGHTIQIVGELDFWDAMQNHKSGIRG